MEKSVAREPPSLSRAARLECQWQQRLSASGSEDHFLRWQNPKDHSKQGPLKLTSSQSPKPKFHVWRLQRDRSQWPALLRPDRTVWPLRSERRGQEGDLRSGCARLETGRWGSFQDECVQKNAAMFGITADETLRSPLTTLGKMSQSATDTPLGDPSWTRQPEDGKRYISRKAVLVRVHHLTEYVEEATYNLRSMITELTLQTGGEYVVYLLVEVEDAERPIHTVESIYQQTL
ncbi:MAG: hypothetical protein Q9164_002617 [Protoblastenia rupestris]